MGPGKTESTCHCDRETVHADTCSMSAYPGLTPLPVDEGSALPNVKPTGCVLGFGDILLGDKALGCCVIDALLQSEPGPQVTLAYCGGDFRGIEAWLYRACDVHVALAASLGGRPGSVWSFDWPGLNLACGLSGGLDLFRDAMGAALTRLSLIDSGPAQVTFHVVETGTQTGFGMTQEALRAARKVVGRVLRGLNGVGLAARRTGPTDRLYRSIILGRAF
ncbi:hypothetical protein [Fundidesulfovibrio putealis]|uniref:hypothetical protein n=1 Tax=Fundidesulfovibrio putealis TaxID=270496 RepID=UPI000486FD7E|nr:hypothetical protein [Fundidesulfovibrio putealis]